MNAPDTTPTDWPARAALHIAAMGSDPDALEALREFATSFPPPPASAETEGEDRCPVCDRPGGQHWYEHSTPAAPKVDVVTLLAELDAARTEIKRLRGVCNDWGSNYQSWRDATRAAEEKTAAAEDRLAAVRRYVDETWPESELVHPALRRATHRHHLLTALGVEDA